MVIVSSYYAYLTYTYIDTAYMTGERAFFKRTSSHCTVYNTNQGEIRPNITKFYLLHRTTCFDLLQVILRFMIAFYGSVCLAQHVLTTNCELEDELK
jgi:hypothetical protein